MASGWVHARAPATIANVGPGFDVFSLAVRGLSDDVAIRPANEDSLAVTGLGAGSIPTEFAHNTAGIVIEALRQRTHVRQPLAVRVQKGIPPGRGLGSSAASCAAAALAFLKAFPRSRSLGGGAIEKRERAFGATAASGVELSTVVASGSARCPPDSNALHILSAAVHAATRVEASANTVEPDPLIANPAAPAAKAAARASSKPGIAADRAGSTRRSSRQRPARAASPRESANANVAARPMFPTASRSGTVSGRSRRMSAVLSTTSGIAIAMAIRGLTDSRARTRGSVEAIATNPPRSAPATLS